MVKWTEPQVGHWLHGFLNLNGCERSAGGQAGPFHVHKNCKAEVTINREERWTDLTCNADVEAEKSSTWNFSHSLKASDSRKTLKNWIRGDVEKICPCAYTYKENEQLTLSEINMSKYTSMCLSFDDPAWQTRLLTIRDMLEDLQQPQ